MIHEYYTITPNGRLWICCKPQKVNVTILLSHIQLVHCKVEDKESQFACEMTFVYGDNVNARMKELWRHVK